MKSFLVLMAVTSVAGMTQSHLNAPTQHSTRPSCNTSCRPQTPHLSAGNCNTRAVRPNCNTTRLPKTHNYCAPRCSQTQHSTRPNCNTTHFSAPRCSQTQHFSNGKCNVRPTLCERSHFERKCFKPKPCVQKPIFQNPTNVVATSFVGNPTVCTTNFTRGPTCKQSGSSFSQSSSWSSSYGSSHSWSSSSYSKGSSHYSGSPNISVPIPREYFGMGSSMPSLPYYYPQPTYYYVESADRTDYFNDGKQKTDDETDF